MGANLDNLFISIDSALIKIAGCEGKDDLERTLPNLQEKLKDYEEFVKSLEKNHELRKIYFVFMRLSTDIFDATMIRNESLIGDVLSYGNNLNLS